MRDVHDLSEAVERAAGSEAFSRSKHHAGLLRFLASRGASAELKETLIGHEFFGRPADYDPKIDPVVRVEVRRLRERLSQYYRTEGAGDRLRIEIPKGSYAPVFTSVEPPPPGDQIAPATAPEPAPRHRGRRLWAACALGALAILAVIAGWRRIADRRIQSIAVLPLTVDAAAADRTAVVDGLAREIATELSQIAGLRVVGPEASARAQALEGDPRSVARRLDVDAVLSGAVRADGSRLRLQLQLGNAADQSVLWAKTLERDLVDPFTLENELAASVASTIHLEMLRRPASTRPVSPDALLAFREGRMLLERRTSASIRQAIAKFREATVIDPRFANAWAARADALAVLPDYGPPEPGWPDEARANARTALQLDPDNADAYAALGWTEFSSGLHAAAASRLLTRAAQLNPNHLAAQRRLAMVLLSQGRFREAEQRLRTALRLDALSPIVRINLGEVFFYEKDFRREEPELRAALELNPNLTLARVMLANMLSHVNRCAETAEVVRKVLQESDAEGWRPGLAGDLARCGDLSMARDLYKPDAPEAARLEVAQFFGDRELELRFIERLEREQPAFLSEFVLGPDAPHFAAYPPTRAVFDRVRRRVLEPEPEPSANR